MPFEIDFNPIQRYFSERLKSFGATPQGADWNSPEAQQRRFDQLLKICDLNQAFSILDYGCGYGALADYLHQRGLRFYYLGYDILPEAVSQAARLHSGLANCRFTSDFNELSEVDYVVESGIFNIRLQHSEEAWTAYVLATLDKMDMLSRKGFAFNLLSSYSDPEYRKDQLYYAEPCFYFDYCKRHFSRNVALLHDYDLYDFTILVRKSTA